MKRVVSVVITLIMALCLLLGSLPVSATYEWVSGQLPADWEHPPTKIEDVTAVDILTPNNPNASQEAKNLLAYLQYVGNSSERIITGNFDYQADDTIWNQIEGQYGVNPALYSTFYQINGSTGSGSDESAQLLDILNMEKVNQTAKEHYDDGCILLLFNGSYENVISDYIVEKGIAENADDGCMHFDTTNPERNMELYTMWRRYVNNITTALKDLEDRGVKAYMYRHFLEFGQSSRRINGCTNEGYSAFVRVQQQFHQALVDAGLTGFLTTWSPMGWNRNSLTRYPGSEYIDVLSVTGYSSSEQKGYMTTGEFATYDFLAATGKPVGFSEISARTGNWQIAGGTPRSSWYNTLKSVCELFPRVSFLTAWGNGGYAPINNDGLELRQENVGVSGNDDGLFWYTSPYAINLTDVIDYKVGVIDNPGIAQLFTTKDMTGKYVGLEERVYNADELKAMGIDIKDIRSIHTTSGYTLSMYTGEDATGDYWDFTSNLYVIDADIAAQCKSIKVGMGSNLAFERDVWASAGDGNAWKINDGATAAWEAKADENGEAWIAIDLGETYALDYYVLKFAGAGGLLTQYNLRGFRIEASLDAENWTVLNSVSGNTSSSITANFDGGIYRYVRLYVTDANSSTLEVEKNDIYVCEWEIYGARATIKEPEPEPDMSDPTDEPSESEPEKEPTDSEPTDEPDVSEPTEEPDNSEPTEDPDVSKPVEEPVESAPAEEPDDKEPVESAPAENVPVESKPDVEAPTEETPDTEEPVDSEPAEDTPDTNEPTENAPGVSEPGESAPSDSVPEADVPAENAPVDSEPVTDIPGEGNPYIPEDGYIGEDNPVEVLPEIEDDTTESELEEQPEEEPETKPTKVVTVKKRRIKWPVLFGMIGGGVVVAAAAVVVIVLIIRKKKAIPQPPAEN